MIQQNIYILIKHPIQQLIKHHIYIKLYISQPLTINITYIYKQTTMKQQLQQSTLDIKQYQNNSRSISYTLNQPQKQQHIQIQSNNKQNKQNNDIIQTLSQNSQNKIRHKQWIMLQCQFWIFHLFILTICLYLISQFSKIDIQANTIYGTSQYKYALEAIQQWKKGYIIDIKQVNTDNCPQGYTQLIKYNWPGTIQGCYCKTILLNHATQYILQGACSSQLINYGCTTIPPLSTQNMKMWKGSKLLCYKRIQSLNFYNSTLSHTRSGTILKSCANNKNYKIQTLPQLSCPITTISNLSYSTSTQIKLQLDIINNNNLYYDNQQNYPIADFKLTQYSFCPYFNDINISPQKKGNYILELTNYSITCIGVDPRIVEFDYMTQQYYLTNNTNFLGVYDMISQLPGYPRPSISYAYRLGYIRYPAWSDNCRRTITHNLIESTKHLQFKHITQKTKLILYICVPCMIIIAILIRILYIIRHIFQIKSKKQYNMIILTDIEIGQQIPNLNIIKSFIKQLIFIIIELIIIVITLIILCIGVYVLIQQSQWIKETFNKSCTQQHINWIFRSYQNKIDQCLFIIGRCIMFGVIVIGVQIGHFWIRRRYGDLRVAEKKKNGEDGLSNQGLFKDDIHQKNKENNQEHINLQDSSDIILRKQRQEFKIYDLDNFMGNDQQPAGETGLNFYAQQQSIQQGNFQIVKKKKKKGIKRRNLFKDGEDKQEKEDKL